ncbi:MAG: carbon-nitrogen hydrolase family protein [Planctomycetota bacterium]|nr:carbon-nitrogen hydrolase family protein [Planctomycetota bacterium]
MPMRIAVAQQTCKPGRVAENRERALQFVREALREKADIVVFPEEGMVGYVENLRELAEPVNGPTTRSFVALLRGTSMRVLYGLTERDGEDCYVGATLVGAGGVEAHYRKTHLWWQAEGLRHEPTHYRPGEKLVTFDLLGHRCGIMICYDGDFPEMARAYAHLGCTTLFWLNNRGSRGPDEVKPLAAANSMIIAASCVCGPDEAGRACAGGSNIVDAKGRVLAEIWDREGLVVADVRPEDVPALRDQNPWYRGLRRDLLREG